ncbi:MAG: hypothetical protein KJ950_06770 [Proteobacteria bacterium]|nr:hypothetical protein [Pseudomonadota bacterium]
MTTKLKIDQVIFDPSISNYPYLFENIVQRSTSDEGNEVFYMSCTEYDMSLPYFSATVLSAPNGEKRKILLNHSFVVAILDAVNLQPQLGFLPVECRE